jgi:hypothetical protein
MGKNRFKRTVAAALAAAVLGLAGGTSASADILTFTWSGSNYISGAGSIPLGPNGLNYLTAEFVDTGANTVELTLTTNLDVQNNLGVDEILFNVSPLGLAPELQFQAETSNVSSMKFASGDNNQLPWKFDVDLKESGNDNLGGVTTAKILLTLASGSTVTPLMAASFNAKDDDGYYAAAHIQDTVDGNQLNSAWAAPSAPVLLPGGVGSTAAPLPSPAIAGLGLLSVCAAAAARKRRCASIA